ncbi:TIGR04282 family arsenosugar biosynthesis glycosyltransferase [Lentzea sp. NPDC055074]
MRFCLLIMAKSPVPGQVKTRLCPPLSPEEAADVAAASLLDTLEAALATPGAVPVVALAGVVRREDVRDALAECVVVPQRGDSFGDRLANAHADIARFRMPVLQIGMDTPQVTPALLESCAEFEEAALGFAVDGGWWALGLRDPLRADVLRDVPMSRADTGALTLRALHGLEVRSLPVLSDVDTIADAHAVAARTPRSRFAVTLENVAAVAR